MKWVEWAAHSGIFRLFSSTNTPCSTAVGGCWWCDIGLDFGASAGIRGNSGQPGPTDLKLSMTQDSDLNVHTEIHIDLSSVNRSNSKLKETEVQLSAPFCSLTIHNPTWQPISLKKKKNSVRMCFCVSLVSESLFTFNIRCYCSILPLSPLLFTERVEKHSWEKSFILGFWMVLGTSL